MQELDSVMSAAEEMEVTLNLAAQQDQPSLAAVATSQRGGHDSRFAAAFPAHDANTERTPW